MDGQFGLIKIIYKDKMDLKGHFPHSGLNKKISKSNNLFSLH